MTTTRTLSRSSSLLPEMMQEIRLSGIKIGPSVADVRLRQSAGGVAVDVVRRVGDVAVHVTT